MTTVDQMTTALTARLDGPHSDDDTTGTAWLAAECVRYLNYATGGHAGSGLLHVRPMIDLHSAEDLKKFRQITDETAALVKQFRG